MARRANDPNGTRTRVAGVKGRSPRPLDDGAARAATRMRRPPQYLAARRSMRQVGFGAALSDKCIGGERFPWTQPRSRHAECPYALRDRDALTMACSRRGPRRSVPPTINARIAASEPEVGWTNCKRISSLDVSARSALTNGYGSRSLCDLPRIPDHRGQIFDRQPTF